MVKSISSATQRVLNYPDFKIINLTMIRECFYYEYKSLEKKMKI